MLSNVISTSTIQWLRVNEICLWFLSWLKQANTVQCFIGSLVYVSSWCMCTNYPRLGFLCFICIYVFFPSIFAYAYFIWTHDLLNVPPSANPTFVCDHNQFIYTFEICVYYMVSFLRINGRSFLKQYPVVYAIYIFKCILTDIFLYIWFNFAT